MNTGIGRRHECPSATAPSPATEYRRPGVATSGCAWVSSESGLPDMAKERPMKTEIGLWIDHREAIIVTITGDAEETTYIHSKSGKHLRYSGSSHSKTPEGLKEVRSEDGRDRKFENVLND